MVLRTTFENLTDEFRMNTAADGPDSRGCHSWRPGRHQTAQKAPGDRASRQLRKFARDRAMRGEDTRLHATTRTDPAPPTAWSVVRPIADGSWYPIADAFLSTEPVRCAIFGRNEGDYRSKSMIFSNLAACYEKLATRSATNEQCFASFSIIVVEAMRVTR